MKKMLFFLAIAMLVITGCSKPKPDNPGDDPNLTISFTLSSAFVPLLPVNSVTEQHDIMVSVKMPGYGQNTGFSMPAPGGTRTFKGDTAKLWLGKDMLVGLAVRVYKPGNPLFSWNSTPISPISAKVEKTNVYSFTVAVGK